MSKREQWRRMEQSWRDQEILYRLPEVKKITGWARSTIYKSILDGRFPRPVQLGRQSVAWRKSDLDRWIESRPIAGER